MATPLAGMACLLILDRYIQKNATTFSSLAASLSM
jgi:hypothetical protein